MLIFLFTHVTSIGVFTLPFKLNCLFVLTSFKDRFIIVDSRSLTTRGLLWLNTFASMSKDHHSPLNMSSADGDAKVFIPHEKGRKKSCFKSRRFLYAVIVILAILLVIFLALFLRLAITKSKKSPQVCETSSCISASAGRIHTLITKLWLCLWFVKERYYACSMN